MKKTLSALCAAALLGTLAAAVPTATAARPTVKIGPRALDRGPDVAVPHLEGRNVVDGDIRVRVRGKQRSLMGKAGDGYVLQVLRNNDYQLVRVAPGSKQRVLAADPTERTVLSDDGTTFAMLDKLARRTSIDIRSTVDGHEIASRGGFRGYPTLLDLAGDHLVVASFKKGAVDWNWRDDTLDKITKKPAYEADLSSDRLAYFTDDPYNGGCTVVTTLTRPHQQLWRSCREGVLTFAPDGQRIVTAHKLSDGIGPNRVWERKIGGRLLASYTVGGYFGHISWETTSDLLIDAYAHRHGATARCSEGACERASSVRETPLP